MGGGVIGTSIAFHLAHLGMTDVVLLERSHLAAGSTGRSVGIVETAYASDVNVSLAKRGYEELSRFDEVTGETAGFYHRPYLKTVSQESQVDHLERTVDAARRHGLHARLASRTEISDQFPEMYLDDITSGLISDEAGFCDPHSVAKG